MGKRGKSRKRQLEEIKERREARLPKMPPGEPPFKPVSEYKFEIFLLCVLGVLILIISSQAKTAKHQKSITTYTMSVPDNQVQALNARYPKGYQLFAVTKDDVLPLNINRLPPGFRVNWGDSRVLRYSRDQVRFNLADISYPSIPKSDFIVKFPLRQGYVQQVRATGALQIIVELLGEYEDQVLCAIGILEKEEPVFVPLPDGAG
ncbi:MAG: hypothetical protein Q8Q08_11285 [Candidatus Omnitrophota bacterium]|nr:hypothetical protein [Candidatus Omnitrophota bacterium]MDZ4241483.1 hypothetical protein [Candidatus Omnitrophota bacterium]